MKVGCNNNDDKYEIRNLSCVKLIFKYSHKMQFLIFFLWWKEPMKVIGSHGEGFVSVVHGSASST